MLHGGITRGARIGGVGADDSPYSDMLSQSILDARNILGLWNQAFPTATQPTTTYVPVQVPAQPGLFGMSNTTLLMVGALAVGGAYLFMKK